MIIFTKERIVKGLLEILVVVFGVTIAFWVEQYRENINENNQLKKALIDIEKSLEQDSIQITNFNYQEIAQIIAKIDTTLILLEQNKCPDMREGPNMTTAPLMDFSNDNLNSFISSGTFNQLENKELKGRMIAYKLFTADVWEKEKRLLDYIHNSIIPTTHKLGNVYSISSIDNSNIPLVEIESTKLKNDLNKLLQEYNDKRFELWPHLVTSNSILRIELRKELRK